jgi:hypothetical protein
MRGGTHIIPHMRRAVPINVRLRVLRGVSPTVKTYAPDAAGAILLALRVAREDKLLPRGIELIGIEVTGAPPGSPMLEGPEIIEAARLQGFAWRGIEQEKF